MKYIAVLLFLFLFLFQPNPRAQSVESGVSKELAQFRNQNLSGVQYFLHFNISKVSQQMAAEERIYFDYSAPGQPLQIDFKSLPNSIKKLQVNGRSVKIDHRDEHLVIPSGTLRQQDNEVKITFISSGKPLKIDTNGLAYTFFVPAKAREVFPCFDQPDLKASFSLKLSVPRGWTAVSNGQMIDSINTKTGSTFTFAQTQPVSTYLFAFAAGKFSKYSETRKDRTINFYYRETDRAKIDSSLDKCIDLNFRAIDFISEYLGMPYPFPKFDFVEIPRFSVSGMEHPGAVFYNGRTLFMDVASATEEFARANTIGHEVSHMWFGDDVTMRWFNDVWLKEVFANYLGNRFASSISPQKDLKKKAVLSNHPAAFSVDRYPSSEPINRHLPNLNQAGLVYGPITYNKAPIAIHQLALLMGDNAFRSGLQEYVRTFKGGNADFAELMSAFQKHTAADLKQFSTAWIDQPGRPVIDYSLDTAQGKITKISFTQQGEWNKEMIWPQRFEILLAYEGGEFKIVPVNLTNSTMDVPEARGLKMPDFIVFNSSGEGYGLFPFDERALKHFDEITMPEARAATVINLYERMLAGSQLSEKGGVAAALNAEQLLRILLNLAATEPDKQILERELAYAQSIYWRYLDEVTRRKLTAFVENSLRKALQQQSKAAEYRLRVT
ncbi:MAG: aminopeptidase [Chitinophagaceae bacterium]|nr:MAG: aminopeptidase [Chitinophagaceae bacterium]